MDGTYEKDTGHGHYVHDVYAGLCKKQQAKRR
jgi:hypothetical protein